MDERLQLLQGVKVLEISRSLACGYAGRLLASEKATVKKLYVGVIDPFCDEQKELEHCTDSLLHEALQKSWDIIIYDQMLPAHWIEKVTVYAKKAIVVEVVFADAMDDPTEELLQAVAGWMDLTGCPERDGLKIGGYPASFLSGAHVAFIALAGLFEKSWQASGRFIKVDILAVLLSALEGAVVKFDEDGQVTTRIGNRHRSLVPMCIVPSADGYVFVGAPVDEQWELVTRWSDIENTWSTEQLRKTNTSMLEKQVRQWTANQQTDELVGIGQAFRLPFSKVQTIEQLQQCPQLHARKFWDESGRVTNNNAWYTAVVRDEQIEQPIRKTSWNGLRIVDLTAMWSGPYCTRLFADLGAHVVKIEAPHRPDGIRSNQGSSAPFFKELNRNKKSITLDLHLELGRGKFLDLVKNSDIVVENFSPRVMKNFNLQPEQLATVNDNLIITSLSAFGQTGPYQDYVGYGPTIEAISGIASQTIYDGEPWLPGFSISDIAAGIHGAVSIVSALIYKQRNKCLLRVDVSQYEVAVHMLGRDLYKSPLSPSSKDKAPYANTLQQALKLRTDNRDFYKSVGWSQRNDPAPKLGEHNDLLSTLEG